VQQALISSSETINIGHAGTAMRFLTAFVALTTTEKRTITGSERMQNRPIKPLVEALNNLGAQINYREKNGFPPLEILPPKALHHSVEIDASVSSQFITALLLNAAVLPKPFHIKLLNSAVSQSYLDLTLDLLLNLGYSFEQIDSEIVIFHAPTTVKRAVVVEADWSAASYFYSIVALAEIGFELKLAQLQQNSKQGDAKTANYYQSFGVETTQTADGIVIKKVQNAISHIAFNLENQPDIAQTIAVTAAALGCSCQLTGLKTLTIKETNRLAALQTELQKCGITISITPDSLAFQNSVFQMPSAPIETYQDHRMAMAFAPVATRTDLEINDPTVVSKSFPNFWNELEIVGFTITF
jgi:3-phosphoshikimate 1-carboxyvinyltransferase